VSYIHNPRALTSLTTAEILVDQPVSAGVPHFMRGREQGARADYDLCDEPWLLRQGESLAA